MATRAPGTFPGALAPVCAAAAEPEPVPAVDGGAAAAAAEEDEEDEEDDEDDDELLLLLPEKCNPSPIENPSHFPMYFFARFRAIVRKSLSCIASH